MTATLAPALGEVDRAIIWCWALADWTGVARSVFLGKPDKPAGLGTSVYPAYGHQSAHPAFPVLGRDMVSVDGSSLRTGLIPPAERVPGRPQYRHVCEWSTVSRWLGTFTDHQRATVHTAYDQFYDLYRYRDGEIAQPWHSWAEQAAIRDRRDARMAAGDQTAMDAQRGRALAVVFDHLGPLRTPDLTPYTLF